LSSPAGQRLLSSEGPLRVFRANAVEFPTKVAALTREISGYQADITEAEREMREIDGQLSGYDDVRIRSAQEELSRFNGVLHESQQTLAALQLERATHTANFAQAGERLQKEMAKDTRARELRLRIDFVQRSLTAVKDTKQSIMSGMRSRIEAETKRIFGELAFKKETFADVKIGEDYGISVIHSAGFECLGSMSAAETELLALSFTLALHSVSGFDAPIFIDTPVAKVADQNKVNFGKKLLEVSETKQTVLLFTSSEYTSDLSSFLDEPCSSKVRLELAGDEQQSLIEVIRDA
jgi:DNA sulfur modification protein DndD